MEHAAQKLIGMEETESRKPQNVVCPSIPRHEESTLHEQALVFITAPSTIINMMPYKNLVLVDSIFSVYGPIYLLLGADVYDNIISDGLIKVQRATQKL
ncbi:unnamed protein product [Hermetia illucens]|uniref:Uncharacterized protein n=1 Tax=Hermetia illucens TaxID=343691 RepID=A0A7R8UFC2_HERIL|nr:unnamed protein product [Hermetia illucens]